MSYFDNALADFVKNFAYGDGIRHLADKGYTAERIKKELGYSLDISEIEKIMEKHREDKNKRNLT